MGSVFVSHSKHDKDLVDNLRAAFVRVGVQAITVELEDLEAKYAGYEIARMIRNESSCVVVLLGDSLLNPPSPQYTHNWVNFEVGVAAGSGKDIWVLEEEDKVVKFPIPFVTDYARYKVGNAEHIRNFGKIFKDFYRTNLKKKGFVPVVCPNEDCNAHYNYWHDELSLTCPVCRQQIVKEA